LQYQPLLSEFFAETSQGERAAALQLALLLLSFIAILVILERQSRNRQRFYQTSQTTETKRYVLHGGVNELAESSLWSSNCSRLWYSG
jgi:ABC-type Fe3+ transport system permease subunit